MALLFCAESFPKAFIYQELSGKRIDELCNTWYNKEKSILPVQKKHRSFGAGRRNERGAMTLQQWVRRCLWLGTVLIILLTFPGIPAAKASSASLPLYQDYIYYSVTPRNEVTINSARASITEAVIPETIDGYPVTEIESYAFKDCVRLKRVSIPDTVKKIGEFAFKDCVNLMDLEIPDTVEKIGWGAAQGTPWLEQQTTDFVIAGKGILLSYLGQDADVQVPDGVTAIGGYAFSACDSVEQVELPETLTSIDAFAFDQCRNLRRLEIPDSVTYIGEYAFHWCISLEAVSLPDSVTEVGNHAFAYCKVLQSVQLLSGLKQLTNMVFSGCTALSAVEIPESVEIINNYAFQNCASLREVIIPETVAEVGSGTFEGCTALQKVTFCNPYCRIYDADQTIAASANICGNLQSTAQMYAKKYSRSFISLDQIRGDFDGDGRLTIDDAYEVLKQYATLSAGGVLYLTESQLYACDYNGNGSIEIADAFGILQAYAREFAGKG